MAALLALLLGNAAQAVEPSSLQTPPQDAVAIIGDASVTAAQLDEMAGNRMNRIRVEHYNLRRQVLEEWIARTLLQRQASRRGIRVSEFTQGEIESKARPVTPEEIRAAYEKEKVRFKDVTEAEALTQIESRLRQQRIKERKSAFLKELRANAGVKVLLEPPRVAVEAGDDPARGPKDAPVTIVEFADFQCPYCARVLPTLKRLEEQYGDQIRLVFRHFPLSFHKQAAKAAEAAECAREQGKFWEMHASLFARQANLEVADLNQRASDLGLNTEQFGQCLESGKYSAAWRKDMSHGSSYGVSGTPAFFINGRSLSGAQPYESFAEVIEEELERAADAASGAASAPLSVSRTSVRDGARAQQ
jgi:protein-disulfide isomerase